MSYGSYSKIRLIVMLLVAKVAAEREGSTTVNRSVEIVTLAFGLMGGPFRNRALTSILR